MTPHTTTDPYLLWLDKEIERLLAHYDEVDVPGNEKYALSVMIQRQTLQRAREKYTQHIENQTTDTEKDKT